MYRVLQKQLPRRYGVMLIIDIFFQFPLSATAPMVWLPYSSIDQLLQALGENSANSHNIVVSKPLSCLHQSSTGRHTLGHDYRFSGRGRIKAIFAHNVLYPHPFINQKSKQPFQKS